MNFKEDLREWKREEETDKEKFWSNSVHNLTTEWKEAFIFVSRNPPRVLVCVRL